MKKLLVITVFFLANHCLTHAQHVLKDKDDVAWYNSIAQEEIYVHYNSSLLFTGEYLYYKLYCRNSKSNTYSKTSKVAYIQLVNENGVSFFEHRVLLENGFGQGDFFIPTSIPSGNYKLIAYTHWMRNGKKHNFFASDISVINPYKGDQNSILTTDSNHAVIEGENSIRSDKIHLSTESSVYNTRSKVRLSVKNINGSGFGDYSVSIRKVDNINKAPFVRSSNYRSQFNNNVSVSRKVDEQIFMPEFKGEMLSGRIIDKDNNTVAKKDVVLSLANNESVIDVATTNKKGTFYFHLKPGYSGNDAVLQVLDDSPGNFKIELNEFDPIDANNLKFYKFQLTPQSKDQILQRSVANQIQNGYFSIKPDTVKTKIPEPAFYGNNQEVYNLDEYKRFKTIDETVVEIIEHAWSKKNKQGKREFIVRGREFDPYFGSELAALVLVDGIFIQDHEKIAQYDARKVQSVSVLRDEYYYGSQVYKGVLSIKTKNGEYLNELTGDDISKIKLFKPRPKKNYFNQAYSSTIDTNDSRIPDFRHQLLWLPNLKIDRAEKLVEFHTSDVKGTYEIRLEGFTFNGMPVSVLKFFEVK